MAITRVQHSYNAGIVSGNPSTVIVALNSIPTVGNVLIATVHLANYVSLPTLACTNVTWTLVESETGQQGTISPTGVFIFVGTYTASPGQTVTLTYATNGPYGAAALNAAEYAGIRPTADKTAVSGQVGVESITSTTGTTSETSVAEELWIGAIMAYPKAISQGSFSQSNPQSGFTLLHQGWLLQSSWGYGVGDGVLEKAVDAVGEAQSGTTFSQNAFYCACIATFPAKNRTVGVVDSVGVADVVLRNKSVAVSDLVGVADVVLRNKSVAVSDLVGVADSLSRPCRFFGLEDLVSLEDSVLADKQLNLADLVTLQDAIRKLATLQIADSVALADFAEIVSQRLIVYIQDQIGISDAVLTDKQLQLSDLVSVAESLAAFKLMRVADQVNLQDVAAVLKLLGVSDQVAVYDSVSTPAKVLQVLDSVTASDASPVVNKTLQVSDQVFIVETVTAGIIHYQLVIGASLVDLPISAQRRLASISAAKQAGEIIVVKKQAAIDADREDAQTEIKPR